MLLHHCHVCWGEGGGVESGGGGRSIFTLHYCICCHPGLFHHSVFPDLSFPFSSSAFMTSGFTIAVVIYLFSYSVSGPLPWLPLATDNLSSFVKTRRSANLALYYFPNYVCLIPNLFPVSSVTIVVNCTILQ